MIDHGNARRFAQQSPRLVRIQRCFQLDIHRLGVADKYRHPDAGGVHLDIRVENLLGLDHHFPLFFRRAVLHEHVNMRDDVEGDRLGELFLKLVLRFVHVDPAGLIEQLVHARLAGARYGLIGGDHHPADAGRVMQRLQRHHHLNGGAVGIGDDIALTVLGDGFRVHFRHDQGHVGLHPEAGRVVDHHGAGISGARRELLGDGGAGAGENNVGAFKIEVIQIMDLQHVIFAIGHFGPGGPGGGHGGHGIRGHIALCQNLQHFPSDISRGAYHGILNTHFSSPKPL